MRYGIIHHLVPRRGFGFIRQEGGPDVYFHAAVLGEALFQRLRKGQPVMFELAESPAGAAHGGKRRWQAVQIQLIDRIPGGKLPPIPREVTPPRHPRALGRKATWKRKIIVPRDSQP
jgi:cold shock CspA family protein